MNRIEIEKMKFKKEWTMRKQILVTSIILLFSTQTIAQKAYDEVKYIGNYQGKNITYVYGDGYIDASQLYANDKKFNRDWNYKPEQEPEHTITQKFGDANTYCMVYLDTSLVINFDSKEIEFFKANHIIGNKRDEIILNRYDIIAEPNYKTADKELNNVYRQILKKYKKAPQFLAKLKVSQRLWIKFRDAELEMRFPAENKKQTYGSVYVNCAENFLKEMTIQRTNTLKKRLEEVDEFDVCNGSRK